MANAIYPNGKENFAAGNIDWDANDIRIILVDLADYTYNAAHDALDDVPAGARVAVSGNLANKTNVDGVLDADDVTLSAVTGDQSEAIIMYKHTGTESNSWLIAYWDTGITGIPVTPNGENINVRWNASGILSL